MVAAAQLRRRLHPVAWHRRGLRRRRAGRRVAHRHPDGAPHVRGGGGRLPAVAGRAPVPVAEHAWLGQRADRAAGAAGHPRHPQCKAGAAAGSGGGPQRRGRCPVVRAGQPAGPPACPGLIPCFPITASTGT
ncbi:hypothetical protein G6F40_015784 [Rhizopus arrhizus]|nr:hypothetical protein G6F40_015784 [Rhizopus arrhizus]